MATSTRRGGAKAFPRRRGRPTKFGRPSRAVTLTLPDDVIAQLGRIDRDMSRAIVAVVERRRQRDARAGRIAATSPAAEIAAYGRHAVIVVTPTAGLRKLAGVELVPIGGNRALISLDGPHEVANVELALRDALDQRGVSKADRDAFESVADILRDARQSRQVGLRERTIIVLERKRLRAAAARARRAVRESARPQRSTIRR